MKLRRSWIIIASVAVILILSLGLSEYVLESGVDRLLSRVFLGIAFTLIFLLWSAANVLISAPPSWSRRIPAYILAAGLIYLWAALWNEILFSQCKPIAALEASQGGLALIGFIDVFVPAAIAGAVCASMRNKVRLRYCCVTSIAAFLLSAAALWILAPELLLMWPQASRGWKGILASPADRYHIYVVVAVVCLFMKDTIRWLGMKKRPAQG
jgi:hypothetical protein